MKKSLLCAAVMATMVGQAMATDGTAVNLDRYLNYQEGQPLETIEDVMSLNQQLNNKRADGIVDALHANTKDIAANKEAIRDVQQAAGDAFKTAVKADNNNHRQDQILDKHGSDIASNTEAIRAHYAEMKNNFAAVNSRIDNEMKKVNSRIDNLDNEMKKGFAANAAIAGLFQPYSVGKFNVTAALGGYDSEQAIAIGSGYRFNETFAMKAGVATNTSDFDAVTYNVGVNFEW